MKPVIFGVAALVVGLAGGTGARVFTAPALPAGADSLIAAADSLYRAKHAHGGDAGHESADAAHAVGHGGGVPDPAPAEATAEKAAGHGIDAAVAAHAAPTAAAAEAHAQPPEADRGPFPERFKQVGNILLNMKPAEAAQVIAYLDNDQVQGLLEAMGPRQAAQILTQLPAERAAALSKRLLALPRPEPK